MKYLSLFSGIGAFELALKRIGVEAELVGFSEIDKYAVRSYCAIHGVNEDLNLGDVREIRDYEKLGGVDLITHGSPCQDFSVAGLQAGGDKGSETRSSLMWETVRIIEKVRPKYVIWENVKNLLSAKHRHNFDSYIQVMNDIGYDSYYKVLNAKDYGIPQNRERVFTISIRKDINDNKFKFPKGFELKLKLKDMLESDVPEKYYLSDKLLAGLIANTEKQKEKGNGFKFEATDGDCIGKAVTTKAGQRMTDNFIKVVDKLDMKGGNKQPETAIIDDLYNNRAPRIYDEYAPTLRSERTGLKVAVAQRGRYKADGKTEQHLEISNREIANSITTVQKDSLVSELENIKIRVRKLTPRECFRLMGFSDEDFDKAKGAGISDTQLYKQARKLNCCKCIRSGVQRNEVVV